MGVDDPGSKRRTARCAVSGFLHQHVADEIVPRVMPEGSCGHRLRRDEGRRGQSAAGEGRLLRQSPSGYK
jgi:hypothetical protein